MEKSWIATFLPKDEYKERKMLYFMAEAVFILFALLFFYLIIDLLIIDLDIPAFGLAIFALLFLSSYILLRYTFAGIEYPDITTKKRYKKEKKAIFMRSLIYLAIYPIAYIIIQGFPTDWEGVLDIIGPAILAAIFLFAWGYLSLKKSYKKNQELLDD
ncbi:DUF3278 domain-containing protein [Virgibacillus dakarensis]|uniref:DUF3278 domain-containing protein n=1 Tax=Lentibacillus populi TaxID=1827502 RepID=A0A9W5X825_9BACI|nr:MULTISPECIES: DUF3278 domain-containing protein [Bacillaceae]MBT2216429.1 DUF3278 domain-containing protein [Virgibacillus dakarensis]MTW85875.1 DUF3278 domain-containing protein [Virgibacillus dakarensis]GGB61652.1 hypothetical protein GCM10011409_43620 [Lentibacillus populi]